MILLADAKGWRGDWAARKSLPVSRWVGLRSGVDWPRRLLCRGWRGGQCCGCIDRGVSADACLIGHVVPGMIVLLYVCLITENG